MESEFSVGRACEMKFKEGEYVAIVEREVTAADVKSGLYYQHFARLAGTVDCIYDSEVCISVDPESLPEDILKRHTDIQESIRRKWLNGLSGEARHRLTPEERQFNLAYTILVHSDDLSKSTQAGPKPVAIKSVKPVVPADEPIAEDPDVVEEVEATEPAKVAVKASQPREKAEAKAEGVLPPSWSSSESARRPSKTRSSSSYPCYGSGRRLFLCFGLFEVLKHFLVGQIPPILVEIGNGERDALADDQGNEAIDPRSNQPCRPARCHWNGYYHL
jgi:hypothetical protein